MLTDKLAYSISEVSQLSGLGRSSIYKAIADRALVARKSGRRTVILATDLADWLGSMTPVKAE